jgi:phosphoserine aminotransferase
LLPGDGRFGSGPSKVRPEAVAALAARGRDLLGTSHRQGAVRDVVRRVRDGLGAFLSVPDGYEVVLGNGGTTAFWEVATFCLVEQRSQHLVFGEFSSKFAASIDAAPWLDAPAIISAEPGTRPVAVGDEAIDAYALTQNETSTGVQMEVRRPRDAGGAPASGLVLVDATSGAGGVRTDLAESDVYYLAPQKSFGSEGGLWLAVCSPAAIERGTRMAGSHYVPAFLDFAIALDNSRQNQTYNTPAIATLVLLAEQIEWFNENGGLEWAAGRSDKSAETIYGWAERSDFATPFVSNPDDRSHVVATIDFDNEIDASQIAKTLRANGVVDTEPYRKLGRNQLRIAMFPGIEPSDIEALTQCIDWIVAKS